MNGVPQKGFEKDPKSNLFRCGFCGLDKTWDMFSDNYEVHIQQRKRGQRDICKVCTKAMSKNNVALEVKVNDIVDLKVDGKLNDIAEIVDVKLNVIGKV